MRQKNQPPLRDGWQANQAPNRSFDAESACCKNVPVPLDLGSGIRIRQPPKSRNHFMSTPPSPENAGHKPKNEPHAVSQEFQMPSIGARVPEKVARGVFSTGVLILQGATEFVLDFLLRMNQPHQVAARVVLPINLVPQFIDVLRTNLENY